MFLLPGAGSEVYGLLAHRSPLQDQAHLILYLPEWSHDCADTLYLSVVLICSYLSWQHTSIKLHRHLVTSIFMCVLLRTNLLKLPIWKGKLPFRAPSHLCLHIMFNVLYSFSPFPFLSINTQSSLVIFSFNFSDEMTQDKASNRWLLRSWFILRELFRSMWSERKLSYYYLCV